MSSAVTFTFQVLSAGSTRRTTVRRRRGIDDFRVVGVQLPKSIDQRLCSGGTLTCRTADRMIPDKLRDAGLGQEGPDGRQAGFERQIGAVTQVEHPHVVRQVVVADAQPVEFGEVLMIID